MTENAGKGQARTVPVGRVARLSRLAAMSAGIAGNMAISGVAQLGQARRPTMRELLLTPNNVRKVTDQLAHMRGAAMKVGQLISMDSGDLLPPELADIMARLRADAHFMPPAQLKKVLNANWRNGWLREFAHFDVRPIAAASIGQVHRARLHDGRDIAIKVQYPGIAGSIDSDVANVGALVKMSGLLPSGFDLAPYLEEARQQLHEEADYLREGRHLVAFRALLGDDPRFELPELLDDWTTDHVLTMSFVEGMPIESAKDLASDARDQIATDLVDLVLREIFSLGNMQTDPNFANFRYNQDTGRIVLLDFGATRQIPPAVSERYRRLVLAGLDEDADAIAEAMLALGFVGPDTAPTHVAKIAGMVETVFSDFRQNPRYDFSATDLSQRMQAQGLALAEDGFMPPPPPIDVLHIQRKLGGIFLLAARLGARVPVLDLVRSRLADEPSHP